MPLASIQLVLTRGKSLTEERAQALAQELTEARRAIERLDVQLRAEAAKTAQSLEQEGERTAALAQEAAAARQELTASTAQHRQALDEERARSAALARELAMAQREIETQLAVLRKAGDEAVPLKQAADSATADVPLFGKSATRPMHWHGTLNHLARYASARGE